MSPRTNAVWLALLLLPIAAVGQEATQSAETAVGRDLVVVQFRERLPADLSIDGRWPVLVVAEVPFATYHLPEPAVDEFIAEAGRREGVGSAYRDHIVTLAFQPNDPRYSGQWGPPAISLPGAWDFGLGSHGVRVAVLDDGIASHPDLSPNLCGGGLVGFGGTGEHGTHVAGILGAVTNNAVGVAGTSQACLLNYPVIGMAIALSFDEAVPGVASFVAAGIIQATHNGASIISMSLGLFFDDPVLREAVKYAYRAGVLLVAAAGNSGCIAHYPSSYPEVVGVANLETPTTSADDSGCGEIGAPGTGILSTLRGGGYGLKSGTSMATPFVSGVAAVMKAQNPLVTSHQIRCILQETADAADARAGAGRVNAELAVQRVVDGDLTACAGPPLLEELPRIPPKKP